MQHGQKGHFHFDPRAKATIIQGLHCKQTTLHILEYLENTTKKSRKYYKIVMIVERLKNLSQTQHSLVEGKAKVNIGKAQLSVSECSMKREIRRNSLHTSKEIFGQLVYRIHPKVQDLICVENLPLDLL